MRRRWILPVVIFGVLFGFFLYVKALYNELVTLQEAVKAQWAQVETQLQRRLDLIPNYVEVVKGYMAHEREVFEEVTKARSRVLEAGDFGERLRAEGELSRALGRLLMVVESYPQLRASENFIRLQDELAGTENRIAVERRRYNEAVMRYNTRLRTFPSVIIARLLGFEPAPFFEAPREAQRPPRISF